MPRNLALFLARLATNKHQDLFLVRLGAQLILKKFGIAGVVGDGLGKLLRMGLGFLLEVGVFHIDLTLDAIREGMKEREFVAEATKAYKLATKKVHDEATKESIRQQYLQIITDFALVSNPSGVRE